MHIILYNIVYMLVGGRVDREKGNNKQEYIKHRKVGRLEFEIGC